MQVGSYGVQDLDFGIVIGGDSGGVETDSLLHSRVVGAPLIIAPTGWGDVCYVPIVLKKSIFARCWD